MTRDNRDVWLDNAPVGTFDIELGAPAGYDATAHILFVCPNANRCSVLVAHQRQQNVI